MRNTDRLRSEAPARFCIPFRSGSSPPFVFRKLCQARRSPTPRPVGRKEHGSYCLGHSPGTASEICKKAGPPLSRRSGFRSSILPFGCTSSRRPPQQRTDHRLRLIGSGSVFTIVVFLQFLQYSGKSRSRVDSSSRTDVRLPHIGQTTRSPSLTSTLPHFCSHCKYFFRLPSASSQNPTHLQGKI